MLHVHRGQKESFEIKTHVHTAACVSIYLVSLLQTGSALVTGGHHRGQEIEEAVQTLGQEWKQLTAASTKKGES